MDKWYSRINDCGIYHMNYYIYGFYMDIIIVKDSERGI